MLTDQQLAKLFTRLQVPVALQSILDDTRLLDDDNRMALCDMIASQTPDQALLSISLCSMLLDARLRHDGHRCAEILAMSAEMIIQDYAPLYIAHLDRYKTGTLFDQSDLDFLSTIPEDLESLSDLLSVVADVLPDDCRIYRIVTSILAAQAGAQGLVAETLVGSMEDMTIDNFNDRTPFDLSINKSQENNVVPFKRR